MGLGVPDFRSFEKNAQLLLQVAGRAGRADDPGEVILQTFQPEHPVFDLIKNNSGIEGYEEFISNEIAKREALQYPPTSRLALIRLEGFELDWVKKSAQIVGQGLSKIAQKTHQITVLGPTPSPLAKLRSKYRYQFLIKSTDEKTLHKTLAWILNGWETQRLEKEHNTRLIVDIDPVSMM
jgi:primosomal protein N' (replication factor Y)